MKNKKIIAIALGAALSCSPALVAVSASAAEITPDNGIVQTVSDDQSTNAFDGFTDAEKAALANNTVADVHGTPYEWFHADQTNYTDLDDVSEIYFAIGNSDQQLFDGAVTPTGWTDKDGKSLGFDDRAQAVEYQYSLTGKESGKTITYTFTKKTNAPASLADIHPTLNGVEITGQDWTKDVTVEYEGNSAAVELGTLPSGWTSTHSTDDKTGVITFTLTGPDNATVTYTFKPKANGGEQKPEDKDQVQALKDVTVSVNDTPLQGFDPTTNGNYAINKGDKITVANTPDGWEFQQKTDDTTGVITVTATSPDKATTVTWTFTPKTTGGENTETTYSVDDLKNVTATIGGKTVEGFDPTTSGTWKVAPGSFILISDMPTGWTADKTSDPDGQWIQYDVASPDNTVKVTWRFEASTDATTQDGDGTTAGTGVDGTANDGTTTTTSGANATQDNGTANSDSNLAQTGTTTTALSLAGMMAAITAGFASLRRKTRD